MLFTLCVANLCLIKFSIFWRYVVLKATVDYARTCVVIARILEKGVLKGFRFVSIAESGLAESAPLELLQVACAAGLQFLNAEWDSQYNTLVGSKGNNLSSYPAITEDCVLVSKNAITISSVVVSKQTKKKEGVVAYNALGTRFVITMKKLERLMGDYKATNFTLESTKSGLLPLQLDGSEFPIVYMDTKPHESKNNKKSLGNGNFIINRSKDEIPVLEIRNYTDDSTVREFAISADNKLIKALLNMKTLTPYYYACLMAIKRYPCPGLGTVGVTEDKLFYDISFVAQRTVGELTYLFIHEIMHLAMQHSLRFGARTDHDLWNIACDLYINSIINHDFEIEYGGGVRTIMLDEARSSGGSKSTQSQAFEISCLPFGVYAETVGKKIDLRTETPETIYAELFKENSKRQGLGGGMGQNVQQGAQGNGQGGQGGQGQGGQSGQNGQGQGGQGDQSAAQGIKDAIDALNNSLSQAGEQQKQQSKIDSSGSSSPHQSGGRGQGSPSFRSSGLTTQSERMRNAIKECVEGINQVKDGITIGDEDKMNNGLRKLESGINNMQDAGVDQQTIDSMKQALEDLKKNMANAKNNPQQQQQSSDEINDLQNDANADDGSGVGMKDVNVRYNGQNLRGKIVTDIYSNKLNDSDQSKDANLNASRQALQRISTKIRMEEEKNGELVKNAGFGAGLTQRYVEFGLSQGIQWQELFKNLIKTNPKKIFTLGNPNTDYMSMGMTVAARRAIGRPTHVSSVKFCVDISGSVSDKEITAILSEIANIFTHFSMDGELIYWSTQVGNVGMFSSLKDMLKIEPITDGGTDVRPVFDYLSKKTEVNGKYEEDKVKDIKGVFILTDGCFSMNFDDYAAAFGKKVVWLITSNPVTFAPPFGRVIGIDGWQNI